MASNPMQRKSRISFLLGMFIMLIIGGAIIALLFMQIINLKEDQKARDAKTKSMMVLTQSVKSGDEITINHFMTKKIETDVQASDFATLSDLNLSDLMETIKEGRKVYAKIDLPAGTGLLKNMVMFDDEAITNDTRIVEFSMVTLPISLTENDYIDVRLILPTGQDYIVISKKKVISATETTVWLEMSEDETLVMSNAIVEAYIMTGSKLYATRYAEPGIQIAATPTYPVSNNVGVLVRDNPNIVTTAKNALYARNNTEQRNEVINKVLEGYADSAKSNVESKMVEEIRKTLEERTKYIESMTADAEW